MSLPTSIRHYKVISRLGGGGMAEVFLVVNPGLQGGLQKRLAMKRLLPNWVENDDFKAQFLEETRVVGQLSHPNIVASVDSGEEDGAYDLVMEVVDGVDLWSLCRYLRRTGKQLPFSVSMFVAKELCEALVYAHERCGEDGEPLRIVHRDVSPHNVLLSVHGQVKLSDFGIARFESRRHRTASNEIKGKISYMSPEQIDERALGLDFRSDLFSFGIVMYELFTGRNPFNPRDGSTSDHAIIHRIVSGAAHQPMEELVPTIEPEIAALVKSLLQHQKADRPARSRDVLERLRELPHRADAPQLLAELVRGCVAARETRSPPPRASGDELVEVTCAEALGEDAEDLLEESGPLAATTGSVSLGERTVPSSFSFTATTRAHPLRGKERRESRMSGWRRAAVGGALVVAVGAGLLSSGSESPTSATPSADVGEQAHRPSAAPQPAVEAVAPVHFTEGVGGMSLTTSAPSESAKTPVTTPEQAPAPKRRLLPASLQIIVVPWGYVWIDGEFRGEAPVHVKGLELGQHSIGIGRSRKSPARTTTEDLKAGPNERVYKLD